MIRLLAKCLIPNRENTSDPEVRRAYGMLCGAVGIVLNVLLYGFKALVGLLTGSVAVAADAFNNLSDAGSSIITMVGFKISGKEDDREHPFGHGRAEYVTGLIVAIFILMMGFHMALESAEKIFKPEEVSFGTLSAVILGVSVAVKLYMAAYNASVGKRIQSVSMRAAALDSLSDAAATSAVLLSALAGRFMDFNIDGWAGLLVSAMIFKAGYDAAKETVSPLLGNPPDPEFVQKVMEIVNSCAVVRGVHDLVVHDYGPGRVMISLHAEVPANGSLKGTHDQLDAVEHRIWDELNCQAVIHMDPIDIEDREETHLRHMVEHVLSQGLRAPVTVHDFRSVKGPDCTHLIFDAVIPLEVELSEDELKREIYRLIAEQDGHFCAVCTIDRPYATMS